MSEFDTLWVWDDAALAGPLAWYRDVAANRMPAKFRIAATIPLSIEFTELPESALWDELDRLTPLFLEIWSGIRDQAATLAAPCVGPSLLDLCRELADRMLTHCNFCRWDCGIDRSEGRGQGTKFGACKLAAEARVSSYFHHPGEELVYRGNRGSGTIFFTSCNMRCAFCQNGDISTDKDNGMVADSRTLATMAWLLRMEGCHNINWVGGEVTIHLHRIVAAIAHLGRGFRPSREDLAKALPPKADYFAAAILSPESASYAGRFNAPMLWNSNFFMSDPAMKILRLLIDVWLPDFKFGPGRCAIGLSRTPRYWESVTHNLKLIHNWGEALTIRHLVMPGHVDCCTRPLLDWLAATMPEVPVNIMDQYRPDNYCDPGSGKYQERYAEIARRPARSEIREAYGHAQALGLRFETITHEKHRRGLWA